MGFQTFLTCLILTVILMLIIPHDSQSAKEEEQCAEQVRWYLCIDNASTPGIQNAQSIKDRDREKYFPSRGKERQELLIRTFCRGFFENYHRSFCFEFCRSFGKSIRSKCATLAFTGSNNDSSPSEQNQSFSRHEMIQGFNNPNLVDIGELLNKHIALVFIIVVLIKEIFRVSDDENTYKYRLIEYNNDCYIVNRPIFNIVESLGRIIFTLYNKSNFIDKTEPNDFHSPDHYSDTSDFIEFIDTCLEKESNEYSSPVQDDQNLGIESIHFDSNHVNSSGCIDLRKLEDAGEIIPDQSCSDIQAKTRRSACIDDEGEIDSCLDSLTRDDRKDIYSDTFKMGASGSPGLCFQQEAGPKVKIMQPEIDIKPIEEGVNADNRDRDLESKNLHNVKSVRKKDIFFSKQNTSIEKMDGVVLSGKNSCYRNYLVNVQDGSNFRENEVLTLCDKKEKTCFKAETKLTQKRRCKFSKPDYRIVGGASSQRIGHTPSDATDSIYEFNSRCEVQDNISFGKSRTFTDKVILISESDVGERDFLDIKHESCLQQADDETPKADNCKTLPRLAKRLSEESDKSLAKNELTVEINPDKIKITERRLNKKPQNESFTRKKLLNLSMDKIKTWSLEQKVNKFSSKFTFPDYKSFSRVWHRSSFPERKYHVYTLLTIQERIETFRFWPSDSPVSKIDLVEAGFIYKGDGYEVQCDSCKLVKSDWNRGDVPLNIHKFLKPDCEFLKTTFPDLKIPAGRNEIDCPFSFGSQQSLVNQMDAMNIANPIAQNNKSMETNTIKDGEETNSSDTRVPNSIVSAPQQQPLFDGCYTTLNTSTLFPTGANALPADDGFLIAGLRPRHPDYATIQQRIWSFRPWVYGHIQDPPYLVDAGFYFIGREDIVRCYFCDIGLAEWDKEDDPWVEHARHSPDCEYLKREKGPEFIESIQSSWRQIYCPRHPEFADYHIRVESFANWPSDLDQRPNALAEAGFYYTGEEDVVRCHYCDGGLRQWESGDVPWTEHARWFPFCKYIVKIKGLAFVEEIARRYNLLTQSPAIDPETQEMVEEALSEGERYSNLPNEVYDRILELGYTCRQINRAFHRHVQMTGRRHASADELTNILLENEFSVAPSINNKPSSAAKEIAEMKTPSDIETLEPEKLIDMNKQLKQQLICNTCEKNESNIVFSPCGHRIACEDCSKDLSACNACGVIIQAKIKTYLA